jgi:protein-disulfide isomerase-like protein with CxxC motif
VSQDRSGPNEPAVKGSLTRELLLWHDRRFGHEETVKLTEGLSPAAAAMLDTSQPALGVLSASWYPISVTYPMMDRIAARCGNEGRDYAMQANREVVPRMIRGVYRTMFDVVASPETYAKHVGRLWRRLHTTGERSMVIRAPGEAVSRIDRWGGHHTMACWLTIYTMAYVFEAMGYRHWSVERLTCVAHGGERCETLLKFKK